MYIEDTMRCPRCGGDMFTQKHVESGDEIRCCEACGMTESFTNDFETGKFTHKIRKPRACVHVTYCEDVDPVEYLYFGNHPYKFVLDWKKTIHANPDMYRVMDCTGVVYNNKTQNLETIFGLAPIIFPDSYYEQTDIMLGVAVESI